MDSSTTIAAIIDYEPPPFELLWTIGFSGKRFFTADRETAIRDVVTRTLNDLCGKAREQGARLNAVSSLARGGDLVFAEAVAAIDSQHAMPWKCLLPFKWEEFIRLDLATDSDGQPLPADEALSLRRRAIECLGRSVPGARVISLAIDHTNDEQREEAYIECGYHTVDESDVMLFLLRQEEVDALTARQSIGLTRPGRAGTFAVALYAQATGHPMIVFNTDAADVWSSRTILNKPECKSLPRAWFVDTEVADIWVASRSSMASTRYPMSSSSRLSAF